MNGGVSHLETFDPKPELTKYAGKTIEATPFKDTQDPKKLELARVVVVNDANGQQRNTLFPPQVGFKKYGRSGIEVSDWLPHLGGCVDDIAVIRSMYTTDNNHGAQTQFHSGRHMLDGEFPNLGAWVHYGLGSLNDNLPQYRLDRAPRVLEQVRRPLPRPGARRRPDPGRSRQPARLRPAPRGTSVPRSSGSASSSSTDSTASAPTTIRTTPRSRRGSRRTSWPSGCRRRCPRSSTFGASPRRHGGSTAWTIRCRSAFGEQLLATRRLVERGVRFMQVQHGAGGAGVWDAHSGLRANHAANCRKIDRPIAGLLVDLKRRGLLDETIVVFGTEFGRTPGSQGGDGRDHHIYGFSVWMAGGGIKGGVVHGATDEIGFHAVENRHYVTDVHATILHLLGLDCRRLEIPGRKRLDIDHGRPIPEIIA